MHLFNILSYITKELPPVVLYCLWNIGSLRSSPGVSVFVLFPVVSDKLSRETITAEAPSWWRPTHPSLHTSNPLAAVYYTNKINTTSSCFSAVRSHFCWCGGFGVCFFFSVGSGRNFWLQICWRRLPSSFVISSSPVGFPEMELFSEGYVTSPPPPPPLPLRQVKGFLSRALSREHREDHQTASQPRGDQELVLSWSG